jgi:hypothetical protein
MSLLDKLKKNSTIKDTSILSHNVGWSEQALQDCVQFDYGESLPGQVP